MKERIEPLDELPKFSLGESIKISPNLNLIDVLGHDISEFYLDGFGKAHVKTYKYIRENMMDVSGHTPAGPVETKVIIYEDGDNQITYPLSVEVCVEDLKLPDLQLLKCDLYLENKYYIGESSYDRVEFLKEKKGTLSVWHWSKPLDYEHDPQVLLFPQDQSAFENMHIRFRIADSPPVKIR